MNTTKEYVILDGPSRETITDAFKYSYEKYSRVGIGLKVALKTMGGHSDPFMIRLKEVCIVTIEHEDGSGYNFNMAGSCRAKLEDKTCKAYCFTAFYNSQTRKGSIIFSEC